MTVKVRIQNLSETYHKIKVTTPSGNQLIDPRNYIEVYVWGEEEIRIREVIEKEAE
jgi:hypothetical protein